MYGSATRTVPYRRWRPATPGPAGDAAVRYDYAWSLFAAIVFVLACFGYESFAPLMQKISESAMPSIVLRACISTLAVFLIVLRGGVSRNIILYAPFLIFITLYFMRVYDNLLLRNLSTHVSAGIIFSFIIGSIFVPSIAISACIAKVRVRVFLNVLMFVFFVFCVGLLFNLDQITQDVEGRVMLTKLNPIALGSISSSFALLFFALYRDTRNPTARIVFAVGIALMLSVLALSQSRGPLLGLVVSLLVYLLCASGLERRRVLQGLFAVGVLLALTPLILGLDVLETALRRIPDDPFSAGSYQGHTSIGARFLIWDAARQQFLESPFIGDVFFARQFNFYPHNLFLEGLISVGILGSVFLVIHVFIAFFKTVQLIQSRQRTVVDVFLALVFVKLFVQVQFSGSVWNAVPFWLLSIAVIALGHARSRQKVSSADAVAGRA